MDRRDAGQAVAEMNLGTASLAAGAGDPAETLADVVRGAMIRNGANSTGNGLLSLTAKAVMCAVHGVAKAGGQGERAARSIMVGALEGADAIGELTLGTMAIAGSALVLGTFEIGGDVAAAARAAVQGAVDIARRTGTSVDAAVSAAADGVFGAAAATDRVAEVRVHRALAGPIPGVPAARRPSPPEPDGDWER